MQRSDKINNENSQTALYKPAKVYYEGESLLLEQVSFKQKGLYLTAEMKPNFTTMEAIKADMANYNNLIIQSTLLNRDGTINTEELIRRFNSNVKESAFSKAVAMIPGRNYFYLDPGQALLGHRNKIPELMPFDPNNYICRNLSIKDATEILKEPVRLTDKFYGTQSTFVINVPPGKFALGLTGNIPLVFDTGSHVIHDRNFQFNPETGFVDKTQPYISHSTLHIVRVPPGRLAKVWINNKPYILTERDTPYVFNEQIFRIEQHNNNFLFNATDNYIQHGNISIVRVPQGRVAKVWQNNRPFLLTEQQEPYVFNDPQFHLEKNGEQLFFDATANLIEHNTITKIRVPNGKYAAITIKNQPYLLSAQDEPYYFNDALIKVIKKGYETLFDLNDNLISHGNIHIIRVPPGKVAKIWLQNKPWLLMHRDEAYVFNNPLFRIDSNEGKHFFDINTTAIHHDTIHMLNVPVGKIVKAWVNNQPILLDAQAEPYYFNTAQFVCVVENNSHLLNSNAEVISHGAKHILRVPAGKVAKVTYNNEPKILEGRAEPYEFHGVQFEHIKNGPQNFFDATDELIVHGSVKRILPKNNRKAIVFEGGNLKILDPGPDGNPLIIPGASHEVSGFIDTGVKTIICPTKDARNNLVQDKNIATVGDKNYATFTTNDFVSIGATLLVAFSIDNPLKALTRLVTYEEIIKHIESVALSDMSRVISKCSTSEYLQFSSAKPSETSAYLRELLGEMEKPLSIQELIYNNLKQHLEEFGISLTRFSIESSHILDEDLAKSMSKQAQTTAATSGQKANMEGQFQVAKRQAEQQAEIKNIEAQQKNLATVNAAQAELDAAELRAKAIRIIAEAEKQKAIFEAEANKQKILLTAEGEKQAILLRAQAEQEAIVMKAKAKMEEAKLRVEGDTVTARQVGESYKQWPELFDLEKVKLQTTAAGKALERWQAIAQLPPGYGANLANSALTLFNQGTNNQTASTITNAVSVPTFK